MPPETANSVAWTAGPVVTTGVMEFEMARRYWRVEQRTEVIDSPDKEMAEAIYHAGWLPTYVLDIEYDPSRRVNVYSMAGERLLPNA